MSKKRTTYSAEFKSRLVLELLENEKKIAEIASKNNITPKNLQNWKKIFLDNAVIAMEPAKAVKAVKAVKKYKQELIAVQEENE
ncbi:transposase, partial [Psychromonas hadalis]